MVFLAVELRQFAAEVITDLRHHLPAVLKYLVSECAPPIFSHEHQMYVTLPHSMSAVPYVLVIFHDTKSYLDP